MTKIYAPKLKSGDNVRVIAPSSSLSIISKENREIANNRFEEMGLQLSFGKHAEETDDFQSSSIASRIEDLHDAFRDPEIKMVLPVIGGFNCNQLLKYIDWKLIENNPKIFGGYSDTTALQNAIFTKTGLVTYSNPAYASFGQKLYFDYTLEYFKKCFFNDKLFEIRPSENWSNDKWYMDQNNRRLMKNEGWLAINEGEASGTIIGGSVCTLNLLQGTEYMPSLENSILFVEDDYETKPQNFDRDLQSLIHQPGFKGAKGIVIGRFENSSEMTNDLLIKIIKTKQELTNVPVIANVDLGHTDPMITFPIGGEVKIKSSRNLSGIEMVKF